MTKPIAFAASQVIGVVDSVSPSEIIVRIENEAPQATSLNAGHMQRFPRINGWVLIPSEIGYLIGTVTWVGIDRSPPLRGFGSGHRTLTSPFHSVGCTWLRSVPCVGGVGRPARMSPTSFAES